MEKKLEGSLFLNSNLTTNYSNQKRVWEQHKDRNINQWNRMKGPERIIQIYGPMIFQQVLQDYSLYKGKYFQQMVLGKQDAYIQNSKVECLSYTIYKNKKKNMAQRINHKN